MSDAPTTPETPTTETSGQPAAPQAAAQAAPETPAAPAGPSPAELRKQLMAEKLSDLRARKAQRTQSNDYSNRLKELEAREAEVKARHEKLSGVTKDPISLFRELGIAPEALYQALTDKLLDSDTPEAKQKDMMQALKEELLKETKPVKEELEAYKKELEQIKQRDQALRQRAFQAEKGRREQELLTVLKGPDYEDMGIHYEDDQLVAVAYQVATALAEAGLPYDYDTVAKKMNDMHTNWKSGVEKRSATRKGAPAQAAPAAPAASKPAGLPSAIGNSVVAQAASNADAGDTKERQSRRAKELENFLKSKGFGV